MGDETASEAFPNLSEWLHALDSRVRGLETAVHKLATGPEPSVTEPPVLDKSAPGEVSLASEATAQQQTGVDDTVQREYDRAYGAYADRRYAEALSLFNDFLKRYPDHQLADNAQYWLGEIHYDMGDYATAILTFKDVVTRYTDHAKAPDALLKIGYAYIALDDVSNARMFLKRVINNYPLSAAESKARAKLKELEGQ
jgi:tol-pal system protein YbgF